MRLRYTGAIAQTFECDDHRPGPIAPGQEFDAPDHLAERYTRRPDIEVVATAPAAPPVAKTSRSTNSTTATPAPAAE